GVAHPVPRLGRNGRPEPARAERGCRVRDAPVHGDAALPPAADGTVGRGGHGVRLVCRHLPPALHRAALTRAAEPTGNTGALSPHAVFRPRREARGGARATVHGSGPAPGSGPATGRCPG